MNILEEVKKYINNPQSLERLGHCSQCPSFNKDTFICNECGCLMRLKVLIPISKCPLGKW